LNVFVRRLSSSQFRLWGRATFQLKTGGDVRLSENRKDLGLKISKQNKLFWCYITTF